MIRNKMTFRFGIREKMKLWHHIVEKHIFYDISHFPVDPPIISLDSYNGWWTYAVHHKYLGILSAISSKDLFSLFS